MFIWGLLMDVHSVCNQEPQKMSRPGPTSGARSGKSNKSLENKYLLPVVRGLRSYLQDSSEATYRICRAQYIS